MGGSSGGEQHIPYEQPDGLKSRQELRVVDMIGEGEIGGPVGGLKGVFLDGTPIENADGSTNFTGVRAVWVNGAQHQHPLPGFPGVRTEVPVSVELKYNQPLVRTVTDPSVNSLRITVGVPALFEQHDNGDIYGTRVDMVVQVKQAGTWVTRHTFTIDDKTRNQYLKAARITNLPPAPFQFRVVRHTHDSDSSKLSNKTIFQSYTEIIDVNLSYPNTALAGLELDSTQFSGVPKRTYLVRGRRVKIPSNYNPDTREYTGIWDGRFKIGWTDNPAWVYYDLATCARAGIGQRLGEQQIDKWTLYAVAQYCDQLVDDGHGGKEPRMTCNVVLADAAQAYTVFSNMSSIFRALPIWTGTALSVSIDAPADPVALYTAANVVEGKFSYQSSGKKSRHTAVHVDYQDPDNGYKTRTEYVADDDQIARYGLNIAKITAFACASRGQAIRAGKWLLETEKRETHTVSFSVFREGLKHAPGDVIEVSDAHHAGARMAGRVVAVDVEAKRVTLDAPVELGQGNQGWFAYINDQGKVAKIAVFNQPEPAVLVLDTPPHGLAANGVFHVSTAALAPRKFRCINIGENNGVFSITALEHVPEKHQIIENGIKFEPPNDTLHGGKIPAIERLQVEATPDDANVQVRLTWDTPRLVDGIVFEVKLLRGAAVAFRNTVDDTEYTIRGAKVGDYVAEVRGKNALGQVGPATTVAFKIGPPAEPVGIVFTPTNFSVAARPEIVGPSVVGTEYEWYFGNTRAEVEQKKHLLGRGHRMDHQGRKPDTEYWYGVQAVNAVGRSGLLIAATKTLLKPEDILDLIGPEIPQTRLDG